MHKIGYKIPFVLTLLLSVVCGPSDNTQKSDTLAKQNPMFVDVTKEVNLDFVHDPGVDGRYFMPESIGSGGAFLDYDNDGDLDIYLINSGPHNGDKKDETNITNQLFRHEGNGTFANVTAESGLGDTGYGMGVAVGDINNDGHVDVYVTNYGPDALYRNNGDGTFGNISKQAGITNPQWGCSAVFFDYNLDTYLDIYVTNYVAYDPTDICMDRSGRQDYCGPAGFPGVPDVLYRNNGDATFMDVSMESGLAAGASKGLGVVSADFNGDHWPDVYVANDQEANHLWINMGDGTFTDKALMRGIALNELGRPEAGMGIALGDAENDSDLDLFVTHLRTESNTFYRSEGEHGYQDDTVVAGLAGPSIPYTGFGTGFFDYDHDGDLDLAVVNGRVTRGPLLVHNRRSYWDDYAEPNFLYENDGQGQFRALTAEESAFGRPIENSRGLAFGDVDNDGDIDLLVTNEGGPARLFRNEADHNGHWLIVRAVDPNLDRNAIGATITVHVGNKRMTRLINPGYSFCSSNDVRAHFGLAEADAVDEIAVLWPDGTIETFPGAKSDQIITLKRGQSTSQQSNTD
ncbi:CRTAC1 family protein [candidate division KSB1 bacterium]|nr:CRTAC1 family protein [candidate division KSB1 bacterium]NIR72451.1 CRTAC1 family protein [candidate division KSB1 bacterium]NIS25090.1 CRTAC1 family protein [candidate division KSB1 bacterium]NIT72009.1 CRTAC1 family protein [candidate division KSB1 bacterium]NIU25789.1 CRTAC1 family protein [candidate division KSB1 bacterium]